MTENNPPTPHDQTSDPADEAIDTTTIELEIKLEYSAAAGFTFHLEYTDGSGTWTDNLNDGGTVAFVNDGQYTLFNSAGTPMPFTFNAVSVSLGSSLRHTASKVCGSTTANFDFSTIQFPALGSAALVANLYAWCQGIPPTAADVAPVLRDPKLGLSNSKGSSGFHIPTSSVSCSCAS